jgi:hypothetical protein
MADTMETIFTFGLIVMVLFNIGYVLINPSVGNQMIYSSIASVIVVAIIVAIASGFRVLNTGLGEVSVRMVTGVIVILNIFFRISLTGYATPLQFTIGLGLAQNMIAVFHPHVGDWMGFMGFMLVNSFVIVTLIAGLGYFANG